MAVVEQLDIYSQPSVDPDFRPRTPQQKWDHAVALNPQLPAIWADTARQLLDQGVRATANRVAEEIRGRHRTVGDEYQFNNTWRAPAAAWLRDAHPDLAEHMTSRKARR